MYLKKRKLGNFKKTKTVFSQKPGGGYLGGGAPARLRQGGGWREAGGGGSGWRAVAAVWAAGGAAVIKGAGRGDLGEGSASGGGVLPGLGRRRRWSGLYPDPARGGGGWLGRPARLGPWPIRARGLFFFKQFRCDKKILEK